MFLTSLNSYLRLKVRNERKRKAFNYFMLLLGSPNISSRENQRVLVNNFSWCRAKTFKRLVAVLADDWSAFVGSLLAYIVNMISNSFLKIFLILSAIKLYHETNLLAVVIVFSLIISDVIRHKLLGLFADLCTSSYRTTIDMKTTLRLKKS